MRGVQRACHASARIGAARLERKWLAWVLLALGVALLLAAAWVPARTAPENAAGAGPPACSVRLREAVARARARGYAAKGKVRDRPGTDDSE